jgi:hypothetical protein
MKTQRRHELQTNVLADWIGKHLESVRPYSKVIGGVVVVVLVVALAAAYIRSDLVSKTDAAWEDYYTALAERDESRMQAVANEHPGETAALWAALSEGDLELARGVDALFTNRNDAVDSLLKAENQYQKVREAAVGFPIIQQRAWYGLAQIYESRAKTEQTLKKAIDCYNEVAKVDPNNAFGKLASERAALLEDPNADVDGWYRAFWQHEPAPPSETPGLPPGLNLPGDLGNLPDLPDLQLPSDEPAVDPSDMPGDEASQSTPAEEPESTTPAEPESPEATEGSSADEKAPPADAASPAENSSDDSPTSVAPEEGDSAGEASPEGSETAPTTESDNSP